MNTSVKKNAHLWQRHPQDFYVEPEWCSERLFDVENFTSPIIDPACGLGRIVKAARACGHLAEGHDIVRRSPLCARVADYLSEPVFVPSIVSNPPFGLADEFVRHALAGTIHKIAFLLPTKWMNGARRGKWLETTPLMRVWLLGPRPSMPPGPVIEAGEKPGNGTTDFAWFVWHQTHKGAPTLGWLRREAAE